VKKMEKTKVIVLLIAVSLLLIAVAGIAYAQYTSAETTGANNSTSQSLQGTSGSSYPYPQQGYYPYGSQYAYPYGYRMGMGMCGRYW
jgi:flagellar basal body-associated protein FliL